MNQEMAQQGLSANIYRQTKHNMKQLLMGIDLGTSGCKVSVIDENGTTIATSSREIYSNHPHPGWSEQDPNHWFDILAKSTREIMADPAVSTHSLAGISLDGSTHNAVLLDEAFEPLRPVIMWTDCRSLSQVEKLENAYADLIYKKTYQIPAPTWSLPQLMWIREHEPRIIEQTRKIMFAKDYLRFRLTGSWESDYIEVQGSMLYDVVNRCWDPTLCGLTGIDTACFPPVCSPTTVTGTISSSVSAVTGLPAGTPVIAGSSDVAVEDYAAGAITPGDCILKLATAGNVNIMTGGACPSNCTLTYEHIIPGMWMTIAATSTAASGERWFRNTFCAEDAAEAKIQNKNTYALMHEKAEKIPAGSDGIFFHPYLLGERAPYWDPHLRGSFTGLAMHHTRAHCTRALLEGVAYSLRDCFTVLEKLNLPVTAFRLIGGGAQSDLWSRIVAAVFNAPVIRVENCDASFGSALLAGVGTGVFSSLTEAVTQCVREKDIIIPNQKEALVYEKGFSLYRMIHDQLATMYKDLNSK